MFPNIITQFTDAGISQGQHLGMQGPHLKNIHHQAGKLSNQAKSIATVAKAMYAENTTLQEENTDHQTKLWIQEEYINTITTQLHQLQLQMAAQAFSMNTQTMGHRGHNNLQCNKQGGHGGEHRGTTTTHSTPPIMQQPPTFNPTTFPDYYPMPSAGSHHGQTPTYSPFA